MIDFRKSESFLSKVWKANLFPESINLTTYFINNSGNSNKENSFRKEISADINVFTSIFMYYITVRYVAAIQSSVLQNEVIALVIKT